MNGKLINSRHGLSYDQNTCWYWKSNPLKALANSDFINLSLLANNSDSMKIVEHVNLFLNQFQAEPSLSVDCRSLSPRELAANLDNGFHCDYNITKTLESTPCAVKNNFNYFDNSSQSYGPCVAIKLNRIFDWTPEAYDINKLPEPVNTTLNLTSPSEIQNYTNLVNNVFIKCEGFGGVDRDALRNAVIMYFSPPSSALNTTKIGYIPFFYYPYRNQKGYTQPLVFVYFKQLPTNQLINILCKAYALNIDSRGMDLFNLFVRK